MQNLEITTSLDQSLITEDQVIFQEVDERITDAIKQRNADLAFVFCKQRLIHIKRESLYLAKALWMISKSWDIFQLGDDFIPTANDYLGLHPHTIERYVKIWEMLTNYVPAQFKDDIQQKNINSLIPIANALAAGYEVEEDVWKRLAEAPDNREISSIVREEVTGKEPRKNNLTLKVDIRGSIWAYTKSGVFFVGSLEIEDENEFVKKSIERIIANSGMLRG